MHTKVTVIGAGVSGLTTAVVLQEAGYEVTVVAEFLPPGTNSDRAGAIWFPTRVGPPDRVAEWGKVAFERFESMAKVVGAGVSMVELLLLGSPDGAAEDLWKATLPGGKFRRAVEEERPAGFESGHVFRVPFIEPEIYLPYLMGRFLDANGEMVEQKVTALGAWQANGAVVNCAGLGAGPLTGDRDIFPIYGHTVRISPLANPTHLLNDGGPDALTYIFSRSQDTLLGGTATKDPNVDSDAAIEGILHRAAQLNPEFFSPEVLGKSKGARPYRKSIRLERGENGILHNYGHGGAGFTVSWGCAEEILRLLKGH